ncbi:hypothetical protein ILUMI_27170 [Ignelater luminosus]|uniref:Peptidase S1 domain-containing protein n=1 Tax=Ignelater luminosus TaxID=2038154 RepID=A0A8K0C5D1_IGNLU|nr:hypothetical protein ILUMI_27170 [Ignelater luminosus]
MILQVLFIFIVLVCKINGHPEINGRIVGGTPINITSCPYQLSLQYYESHICGASILNAKNVITAAHCVYKKTLTRLSVHAGSTIYHSGGIRKQVARAIIHKSYNDDTSDYDIAILHLSEPLSFGNNVLPIALPRQGEPLPRRLTAIVSGWGYTHEDGDRLSPTLLKIAVSFVGRNKCNTLYFGKGDITPRMFCAGDLKGGRDACQGDSGGPCIVNGKLVGLVSWGYGCARPGYPGVYTKVSNFINWINNTIC